MSAILGMLGGAAMNGLSGVVNEGIDNLLGISKRKDERQLKQQSALNADAMQKQKELNESTALTNYTYGEKAAETAYGRTKEMYEKQLNDNSPEQQVKRLEDAGLSVGMMMGGAGSTGGASATPQAQATTGGAQAAGITAGKAATRTEMQQQEIAAQQMGMQNRKLESEIAVNESIANKNTADAKKANTEATTGEESRNIFIENLKQDGIAQWLENNIKEYQMRKTSSSVEGEPEMEVYKNTTYGKQAAITNSAMINEEKAMKIAEAYTKANLNAATEELTTTKQKGYWTELLNATMHAEADQIKANAMKLGAEYQTGEFTNWQTWSNIAQNIAKIIGSLTK